MSNTSETEQDVVTRLALVRMAMASFLSLWNEYAVATDRQTHQIVKNDHAFISQIETDVKADLGKGERFVNATGEQLAVMTRLVGVSKEDQVEFEDDFDETIRKIRKQTDAINDGSNAAIIGLQKMLDGTVNGNNKGASETMDEIEGLIDHFVSEGTH